MSTTNMQGFKKIHWKLWEKWITQTLYRKAWRTDGQTENCLSPKCHNFVKNYFFPCKNSHVHLQYIHNKCAWFQNDALKTVRGVDYTNSIPYNAKSCLKCLSSKGCNSVKINSSSTKNPHAHLQYVHNKYARFQKDPMKPVGGVDYTNSIPLSVTNGRTDGRTDRQTDGQTEANLNAPDYRHGGIKIDVTS